MTEPAKAIYADMLGEAEAIYGHPADASLRGVLRRLAEKEAIRRAKR